MRLTIRVTGADGAVKGEAWGEDQARLVYLLPYAEGDAIRLSADGPGFVVARLEDSLPETPAYLSGGFALPVPFGEKRVCYSPKCFAGDTHLLCSRAMTPREHGAYRNLAFNPLDHHGNTALFPHASANVETRGESVFAARNAINGNTTSAGHGPWPYESWGINRRDDAELRVDFGRLVRLDRLVITLRADFPHDNWWTRADLRFSDGSTFRPHFVKSGLSQIFDIPPRTVARVTMSGMVKDESDPSPFPALTQIECWGHEVIPRQPC